MSRLIWYQPTHEATVEIHLRSRGGSWCRRGSWTMTRRTRSTTTTSESRLGGPLRRTTRRMESSGGPGWKTRTLLRLVRGGAWRWGGSGASRARWTSCSWSPRRPPRVRRERRSAKEVPAHAPPRCAPSSSNVGPSVGSEQCVGSCCFFLSLVTFFFFCFVLFLGREREKAKEKKKKSEKVSVEEPKKQRNRQRLFAFLENKKRKGRENVNVTSTRWFWQLCSIYIYIYIYTHTWALEERVLLEFGQNYKIVLLSSSSSSWSWQILYLRESNAQSQQSHIICVILHARKYFFLLSHNWFLVFIRYYYLNFYFWMPKIWSFY